MIAYVEMNENSHYLTVRDEKGHQIGSSKPYAAGTVLLGYTSTTYTLKTSNGTITTYDENSLQIGPSHR